MKQALVVKTVAMDTEQIVKNYLQSLHVSQQINSLENISALADAHLKAYTFGNSKILIAETVPIDLPSIYDNLIENSEADFQMGNFYSYMNPEGLWCNNLVVSCYGEDSINSLLNNLYFKIYANRTEQLENTEFEQFVDIMKNDLKLNYSDAELPQLFEGYVKG